MESPDFSNQSGSSPMLPQLFPVNFHSLAKFLSRFTTHRVLKTESTFVFQDWVIATVAMRFSQMSDGDGQKLLVTMLAFDGVCGASHDESRKRIVMSIKCQTIPGHARPIPTIKIPMTMRLQAGSCVSAAKELGLEFRKSRPSASAHLRCASCLSDKFQ